MEKKEDRRIAMTRRMLKDALTEMLRETDIYHVSIRELCQRADINRTTFYKYYGSQFDLLTDMENDLLEFLSSTIREYAEDPVRIIETACLFFSPTRSRSMRRIPSESSNPPAGIWKAIWNSDG